MPSYPNFVFTPSLFYYPSSHFSCLTPISLFIFSLCLSRSFFTFIFPQTSIHFLILTTRLFLISFDTSSPRYQDTILVQYELVTAPGWIMSVLFSLTLLAVLALFSDPIIVKQKPFIRLGNTEKKNENDGRSFFSMIFSTFPFSYFFSNNIGKLSTRSSSSLDASGVSTSGGTYGAIPVEEQVICIELGDLMDKGDGNIPAIDEEYGCKLVDMSEKRKKSSASISSSTLSSTSTTIISPLRSAFSQNLNSHIPLNPKIAKQINKDSGDIDKIGNKSIRENENSKNNNNNNNNKDKDKERQSESKDDINSFSVEQLKPIINLSNSNINLNSIAGHEIKRNLSQTDRKSTRLNSSHRR